MVHEVRKGTALAKAIDYLKARPKEAMKLTAVKDAIGIFSISLETVRVRLLNHGIETYKTDEHESGWGGHWTLKYSPELDKTLPKQEKEDEVPKLDPTPPDASELPEPHPAPVPPKGPELTPFEELEDELDDDVFAEHIGSLPDLGAITSVGEDILTLLDSFDKISLGGSGRFEWTAPSGRTFVLTMDGPKRNLEWIDVPIEDWAKIEPE